MKVKEEYLNEIVPRLVATGMSLEEATRLAIQEYENDLKAEEQYISDSYWFPY